MKEFIVFFWDTLLEESITQNFKASNKKQVRESYFVEQLERQVHKVIGIEERSFQNS